MVEGLRGRLIGAWKLVSYQEVPVDGSEPFEPLGHEPHGIIMYTPGRVHVRSCPRLTVPILLPGTGSSAPPRSISQRRPPTSHTPGHFTSIRTSRP